MSECDTPVCSLCKSNSSLMWQRNESGSVFCLDCHTAEKASKLSPPSSINTSTFSETSSQNGSTTSEITKTTPNTSTTDSTETTIAKTSSITTRRTTRSRERANKAKQQEQQKQLQQKLLSLNNIPSSSSVVTSIIPSVPTANSPTNAGNGTAKVSDKPPNVNKVDVHKLTNSREVTSNMTPSGTAYSYYPQRSRRSLNQGLPMKAPKSQSTITTSNSIEHKGTIYEVGDIVSLLDRDGGVYFAVIRGFLQDQYADKFAVLTWLLPRYPNPTHFDPTVFVLGPEEDVPRSMDYIEFVCHSPKSRHFQASYFHDLEQAELWKQTGYHEHKMPAT